MKEDQETEEISGRVTAICFNWPSWNKASMLGMRPIFRSR